MVTTLSSFSASIARWISHFVGYEYGSRLRCAAKSEMFFWCAAVSSHFSDIALGTGVRLSLDIISTIDQLYSDGKKAY